MPSGRTWTTREVRRLFELRAQRVRMVDIAAELGRTENALYAFLRDNHGPSKGRPLPRKVSLTASEKLRDATLRAISRFANDNGLDIDTAARRLLSEGRA